MDQFWMPKKTRDHMLGKAFSRGMTSLGGEQDGGLEMAPLSEFIKIAGYLDQGMAESSPLFQNSFWIPYIYF